MRKLAKCMWTFSIVTGKGDLFRISWLKYTKSCGKKLFSDGMVSYTHLENKASSQMHAPSLLGCKTTLEQCWESQDKNFNINFKALPLWDDVIIHCPQ